MSDEILATEEKATVKKNSKPVFKADEFVAKLDAVEKESAPKAARASKKVKKKELDKDSLGRQIMGFHILASQFLKSPIWMIDEKEASQLADAVVQVSEQYDFNFDPKVAASINLLATAAMIYAPRAFMYRKEVAKRIENAKQTSNS